MPVSIVAEEDEQEVEEAQPVSIVDEERDTTLPSRVSIPDPEEPGFFSGAFDAFQDWRENLKPERKFTRDEAREITKQNIKLNRDIFGSGNVPGTMPGRSKPPSHSALVRAGQAELPEEEAEIALTDYLRGDPDQVSEPVKVEMMGGKTPSFEKTKGEDPWGLVIWDTITNVPAMFKRQYGGAKMFLNAPRDLAYILESAADQGVAPEDSFALEVEAFTQGKEPSDYYMELLKQTGESADLQEGLRMTQEAKQYLENYQPNVREDSAKYYAGAIIEGSINMAPALIAAAVTRSPSVGAAFMGGQVFADQYAESIEKGRSHSESVMDGIVNAAAEIVSERVPLGILTKEGGRFLARVLKAGGAEALQEPLTQLIQEAYTKGIIDKEMSFGEALLEMTTTKEGLQMLKRSAIIGFGVGGSLASLTHPLYRDTTQADLKLDPKKAKRGKTVLPSEEAGEISEAEAKAMGLNKLDVDLDLLERAGRGDPLTIDEQFTLTNEKYGRFIGEEERVMILPKGKRLIEQLRQAETGIEVDEEVEEIILEGDRVLRPEFMKPPVEQITGFSKLNPAIQDSLAKRWAGLSEEQYNQIIEITDQIEALPAGHKQVSSLEDQLKVILELAQQAAQGEPDDDAIRYQRVSPSGREEETYKRREPGLQRQSVRLYAGDQISKNDSSKTELEIPESIADLAGSMPPLQRHARAKPTPGKKPTARNMVDAEWAKNFIDRVKSVYPLITNMAIENAFLEGEGIGAMFQNIQARRKTQGIQVTNAMFAAIDALIKKYDMVREGVAITAEEDEISPTETFRSDKDEPRRSIRARQKAATRRVEEPKSEAIKEAGTYRKAHMRIDSLPVTIETAKGMERSGVDKSGKPWSITMQDDYGYIKGTESKERDGKGGFDQVDVFVGEYPDSGRALIVNQKKDPDRPIGSNNFDEHKVMLGYRTTEEAMEGYRRNYDDGGALLGSAVAMTTKELREWLDAANTKRMAVTDGNVSSIDEVQITETLASETAKPESRDELHPQSVEEGDVRYEIHRSQLGANVPGTNQVEQQVYTVNLAADPNDFASPNVKLIETGIFRSGLKKVTDASQVAHLVAPLRREAQESLMAVVTDEQQNVLSVIRHSIGATDAASAQIPIYLGSVFAIDGAKNVWMVHNHPSGEGSQSLADERLAAKFRRQLDKTGIDFKGSVVVAPGGKASYLAPHSASSRSISIQPLARTEDISVVERRFRNFGKPGRRIESPKDTVAAARATSPGEHAILLNTKHQVVAIVPVDDWKLLRTEDSTSGAGRILAAVSKSNASAMIVVANDQEAAKNALTFGDNTDIRALDAVLGPNRDQAFSGMPGFHDRNTTYFHRRPDKLSRFRGTNAGRGKTVDEIQAVLRPIYSMFRTVPPVRVVQSIEDLPRHLRLTLETEEDRRNTTGIYDQGAFMDDIYIIANNVTDTAEAIETMLHEVIGHFGLRQTIKPWEFDAVMDKVAESFPKEVREIAKLYGHDWNNINERRVAAEEFIAHTAQRVLAGRKVKSQARKLLDEIVKALKNFIRYMTGKATMFTDGQIMSMIAESSNFVQSASGYKRSVQRGRLRHMSSPYYFSQAWTAFNDSDTKAASADGWMQFVKGQINKGKMKQSELDWMGLKEFMEDITWDDVFYAAAGGFGHHDETFSALKDVFPRDKYDLLVQHRRLGEQNGAIREKARKLQLEAFNQEYRETAELAAKYNAKAKRIKDEWIKDNDYLQFLPVNEQRDLAVDEEIYESMNGELEAFGRTSPKKIPKDTILSFITRNGVGIEMYQPGGEAEDLYFDEDSPDEQTAPDEDDWYEHWEPIEQFHWGSVYPDMLIEVHSEHGWDPDLEADPDIAKEADMDLEELNYETDNWDGTTEETMKEEAEDRTREDIEQDYYTEERDEWVEKNTQKSWYSGNYSIQTDSDGDFVVTHMEEGADHGYYSNFDDAVQAADEANQEGASGRWKEYMLEPTGEDYQELLFKWTNPRGGGYGSSGHWGEEEDMVAHARLDTRKDLNGEDAYYVDEIQSDWHQEIRDAIKSKLEEVHAEHEYDPDYVNPDGTIGGGDAWDETSPADMLIEARDQAISNPTEQDRWKKKAEADYKELRNHREKMMSDIRSWGYYMSDPLATLVDRLVTGAYTGVAQSMLRTYSSNIAGARTKRGEILGHQQVEIQDEIYESHGFYADLTEIENLSFAAYRKARKSEAGQQLDAKLISVDEFNEKMKEFVWDNGVSVKQFNATGDDPAGWMQDLYEDNFANKVGKYRNAKRKPRDLPDWTGTTFNEIEMEVLSAASKKLLDPTNEEARAKRYREVTSKTLNKDLWDKALIHEETQDRSWGGAYAGRIPELWIRLSEVMDKLSTQSRAGEHVVNKEDFERAEVKPFTFSIDKTMYTDMGARVLEFHESKERYERFKSGMTFAPFEKDWQLLVMKGLIADAVRNGHDRIYLSKGEVHGVRWSGAETVDELRFNKEGFMADDKTIDMFTGKPKEIKRGSFRIILVNPAGGRVIETNSRDLRTIVGDRAARFILEHEDDSGLVSGEDVGLKSLLIPTSGGGKRLTGSRVIYNVITPQMLNKFLKKFKAKVVDTWIPGSEGSISVREQVERQGLAVRTKPGKHWERWKQARVRRLTTDEVIKHISGGVNSEMYEEAWGNTVIAPEDRGIWGSEVPAEEDPNVFRLQGGYHQNRQDAQNALDEALKSASERAWGYEAWEIEFTDKLKETARSGFPLFHKRGKKKTGDPGLDDALNWAEKNIGPQGPRSLERLQQRINEVIAIEEKQVKIEQAMVDQFSGLKWAIKQTHGHELPAEINAYKQAHFTTSMDSQMFVFLTHGVPYWEKVGAGTITGIKPGSKGLLEVLEPVADKITYWGYWKAAVRADRLLREGREALFTRERIDELLKLGERFPEFQTVSDAFNDWKTQFLDWAEEAGVLNSDTRPLWDQADYVPFYRIKSDEMGGSFAKRAGMGGPGIANVAQPIKRLLGSKHPLGDILENIIINFQHIATATMKNKASQLAVENLKETGLITPAKGQDFMKQEFIPMDELKRKLRKAAVDWEAMSPEALAGMQKMWTLQRPQGDNFMSVLYNGKKKWFEVHEETLLRSLTAINEKKFASLMGRMGMWLPRKFKRLGTSMITLTPGFMAANWFRDIFMAFVNSRHAKLPRPWSAATGAWKAFTKSDEMISMMAAGGAFYSGYINANDPISTVKAMKRALRQTGFKNRVLDAPWKIFHFYNDIAAASENANRIGSAYIPAIKAGAGKAEAVWESKDIMNFAKHGDHAIMQFFAQSVMFLNARIQGLVRYGQRFQEAPGITFTKSMLYAMAVLAVWLKNKDEEWYKALPPEEKDMYVHFKVNGKHWRLPKSFEVGMVFGVGVERMFEYYYSNEDDAGRVAIDRLWFVLGEVFNFFNPQTIVPLPQFIAPLFEATTNWNAFFQAPIVPEYMQDIAEVKPELVFRSSTSPSMRELAKVMPNFSPDIMRNPLLMEHLMRGYLATLGGYVMMLSDDLVRKQFDYPARPELRWSKIPLVGRFYRGEEVPARSSFEEIMYDVRNNARQIERAVNQMERLEMDDEIDEFMEEGSKYDPNYTNQEVLDASKAMESSYNEIKKLRKDTTDLWEDEDMTPEQKSRELNDLYREKLENAKDAWMERPGAAEIQIEALQETLIDMPPQQRTDYLAKQRLDHTAELLSSLPKNPRAGFVKTLEGQS